MNKEVYLIYKTDNWHSYESRDLLAVCDCWDSVIKCVGKYLKSKLGEEYDKIKNDVIFHLKNYKQTQNLWSDDFEIDIERITINELL